VGHFPLLDPDPDSESGSRSNDPNESGSNWDPYPDTQPCFHVPYRTYTKIILLNEKKNCCYFSLFNQPNRLLTRYILVLTCLKLQTPLKTSRSKFPISKHTVPLLTNQTNPILPSQAIISDRTEGYTSDLYFL
jgi:hypothetical protein